MTSARASGILLHPTSLPGRFGIGDLGPEASRWVDFLAARGPEALAGAAARPHRLRRLALPVLLGLRRQPEPGEPRAAARGRAAGAGRPRGRARVPGGPRGLRPGDRVEAGGCWRGRTTRFAGGRGPGAARRASRRSARAQAGWLDDFALFMALKDAHGGAAWTTWEARARARASPAALAAARERLAGAVDRAPLPPVPVLPPVERAARPRARERASASSATCPSSSPTTAPTSGPTRAVPARREGPPDGRGRRAARLLQRRPASCGATRSTAGTCMRARRLRLVDRAAARHARARGPRAPRPLPRLRGLLGGARRRADRRARALGAGAGREHFFERRARGAGRRCRIIAEDLGLDHARRWSRCATGFELPGMKVLQFAFDGDARHPFLPHNYERNCVVYTGTHDNDTTLGWYATAPEQRARLRAAATSACDGPDIAWDLVRAVHGLGGRARASCRCRTCSSWAPRRA